MHSPTSGDRMDAKRPQRLRVTAAAITAGRYRQMVQLEAILHTLCMIGSMERACSIPADQEDGPVATASNRGHRTVPAWYSNRVMAGR